MTTNFTLFLVPRSQSLEQRSHLLHLAESSNQLCMTGHCIVLYQMWSRRLGHHASVAATLFSRAVQHPHRIQHCMSSTRSRLRPCNPLHMETYCISADKTEAGTLHL